MRAFFLIGSIIMIGCAQSPTTNQNKGRQIASEMNAHETVFPHPHQHGNNCGHETKTQGLETYYIHDGETHFIHAGHVDKK